MKLHLIRDNKHQHCTDISTRCIRVIISMSLVCQLSTLYGIVVSLVLPGGSAVTERDRDIPWDTILLFFIVYGQFNLSILLLFSNKYSYNYVPFYIMFYLCKNINRPLLITILFHTRKSNLTITHFTLNYKFHILQIWK